MTKYVLVKASLVTLALMSAGLAQAQAPIRNDSLVPWYAHVRGPMCSPANPAVGMITALTPLSTLLFNVRSGGAATCPPVLASDGHQITLGEFKAATGRAGVKCIDTGTISVLHFSGLLPKQLYTAWVFNVDPNFPNGPFLAGGAIGVAALAENHFVSSEAGEGEIVRTTPAGNLSAFGSIGNCFLDNPETQLHLVFHIDQMAHGPVPGPQNTWVVNARFFFPEP